MEKEEQIKLVDKYFIETPKKPDTPKYTGLIVVIVLGIVLLAAAAAATDGRNLGIALLMGGLGVILLLSGLITYSNRRSNHRYVMRGYKIKYDKAEPKATDEQMDKWLEDGMTMVEKEARERLDLPKEDLEDPPFVIDGPVNDTLIRKGKDKMLRFRYHNVLLFFLTEHNVASFECVLDLGCGEIWQDRTKEFPYKDITNLETETTNDKFHYIGEEKFNTNGVKEFNLYTSGGNKMSANYFFSKDSSQNYILPPSTAEATIRAIRKRLKEYKDRALNKEMGSGQTNTD